MGPPGQMGRMQPMPMEREKLVVNLSPKERGFYSNMLSLADPNGNNKVGGKDAVGFFKKSGLPVEKLKDIWKISASTSNEYLSREEFYVALRLIAYA